MKQGDTVPVTVAGHVVAQAEVKEIDHERATLVVPATLVVMGVRTDLTDLPVNTDTTGTQTIIDTVERTSATPPAPISEPVSAEPVAVEPVVTEPVAETPVEQVEAPVEKPVETPQTND